MRSSLAHFKRGSSSSALWIPVGGRLVTIPGASRTIRVQPSSILRIWGLPRHDPRWRLNRDHQSYSTHAKTHGSQEDDAVVGSDILPQQHESIRENFYSSHASDFSIPHDGLNSVQAKLSQQSLTYLARQDAELPAFFSLAMSVIRMARDTKFPPIGESPVHQPVPLSPDTQRTETLKSLASDWTKFRSLDHLQNLHFAQMTASLKVLNEGQERNVFHGELKELWYALGDMVIRASSLCDKEAQRIMHYVHLTIAEMHSEGLIPSGAYNYDDSSMPKSRRKPPYLHTLGSRLMATVSEAKWKASNEQLANASDPLYQDEPQSLYDDPNPRVRPLDPNVWLEFILWSCVHQGYYVEAARLLNTACLTRGNMNWISLSWDQVLELQVDHHRRQQSWFDRVMTLVEGYSEERPLIEMPSNTVSTEMVLSVLDGLLTLSESTPGIRSARKAVFYVYCRAALSDVSNTLSLHALTNVILPKLDLDTTIIADLLLQSQVDDGLPPPLLEDSAASGSNELSLYPSILALEQPHPMLNHLISMLDTQALRGSAVDSLATLNRIRSLQNISFGFSGNVHTNPNDQNPDRLQSHERKEHAISYHALNVNPNSLASKIPVSTLTSLLRLFLRTNNLEAANDLLHDEGLNLKKQDSVSNKALQPALLHAAVALSDKTLLHQLTMNITDGYEKMSDDFLLVVLEAQLILRNISETRKVLRIIQTERGLHIPLKLVATIASHYVKVAESMDHEARHYSRPLRALTCDVLLGRFLPHRSAKSRRDYTAARQLWQFGCIVQSALGPKSSLPELDTRLVGRRLQLPTHIPTDAFNFLLGAVASTFGSGAARALFDRWCSLATEDTPSNPQTIDNIPTIQAKADEVWKVVNPSLETVQIILKAPLKDLQSFDEKAYPSRLYQQHAASPLLRWVDSSEPQRQETDTITQLPENVPNRTLFEWGARTMLRMGYDQTAISNIIPGSFSKVHSS